MAETPIEPAYPEHMEEAPAGIDKHWCMHDGCKHEHASASTGVLVQNGIAASTRRKVKSVWLAVELTDFTRSNNARRMEQPPLNTTATIIRFADDTIDRIDALIGRDQRGAFIRYAVEKELAKIEEKTPRSE